MEEQRISRMYVNLLTGWFRRTWDKLFPRGMTRSPIFFILGLAALVLIPSLGWYLHVNGKFHTAKKDIGVTQAPIGPAAPRPGGADPMVLLRTATPGSDQPELISVTMLPGLGMGVLQVTAFVPGRGEIALLAAPSVQEMADNPGGTHVGALDEHGSIELPWGGTLSGLISPLGTSLSTLWKGTTLSVSRDPLERSGMAEGGMLASQAADVMQLTPSSSGAVAKATFNGVDFGGHWPSKTDVQVTAQLEPRTLDLTVTAKNIGDDPEPMGIGWQPRFAIPRGDHDAMELHLPAGQSMDITERSRNIPSGKFSQPGERLSRFQGHAAALGSIGLDETLVTLKPAALESGAEAELRDPASGYGLRLIAGSPSIQALHVIAPAGAGYVSLGMQTNYDDPTGKEWNGDGVVTLSPGQTLEFKIRLEIFAVQKH